MNASWSCTIQASYSSKTLPSIWSCTNLNFYGIWGFTTILCIFWVSMASSPCWFHMRWLLSWSLIESFGPNWCYEDELVVLERIMANVKKEIQLCSRWKSTHGIMSKEEDEDLWGYEEGNRKLLHLQEVR